jgi:hypothetical protein
MPESMSAGDMYATLPSPTGDQARQLIEDVEFHVSRWEFAVVRDACLLTNETEVFLMAVPFGRAS